MVIYMAFISRIYQKLNIVKHIFSKNLNFNNYLTAGNTAQISRETSTIIIYLLTPRVQSNFYVWRDQ